MDLSTGPTKTLRRGNCSLQWLALRPFHVACGAAEAAAIKAGKADSSRTEEHPMKRKSGASRDPVGPLGMTRLKDLDGAAKAAPLQDTA